MWYYLTTEIGRGLLLFLKFYWSALYGAFLNKGYYDSVLSFFGSLFFYTGTFLMEYVDKGFLEIVGPSGAAQIAHLLGRAVSRYHSGFLQHYGVAALGGLAYLLFLSDWAMLDVLLSEIAK